MSVSSLYSPVRTADYIWGSNVDCDGWHLIREAVGIPDTFTFHDLRHTQASRLLYSGADPKVIQFRLGHAKFETTANQYAHLQKVAQTEATSKFDTMMPHQQPAGTFDGHTPETENASLTD